MSEKIKKINDDYKKKQQAINDEYNELTKSYKSSYDSKMGDLSNYYSSEKRALLDSQERSKQEADITYERLKKYLPLEARANGSNAVGLSEQMQLQASNAYGQNIAAIDANAQESQRLLSQDRLSAESQARTSYESDLRRAYDIKKQDEENALNRYRQDIATEEANMTAAQNNYYKSAADTASTIAERYRDEDGNMTQEGVDELKKYADSVAGKIGNNSLDPLIADYENEVNKVEQDKTVTKARISQPSKALTIKNTFKSNYEAGDDFEIRDGGTKYKVESAGEVADASIIEATKDIADGQVFMYDNEVFIKTNGKVFAVKMRGKSDNKVKVNGVEMGSYEGLRKLLKGE